MVQTAQAPSQAQGYSASSQPPFPTTRPQAGESKSGMSATELGAIRQLKVLEERSVNLRKKAQLADENLLAAEAKLRDEIKLVTGEISELRRRLTDVEEGLRVVEDEMKHSAKIQDVRAIEKYLAYWEPLQFVTQAELARRQNLLKEQGSKALQEEGASSLGNTKTPRITR